MSKMNTIWKVSEDRDLLFVGSGKDYWTNVYVSERQFPMEAGEVAYLLNKAFKLGAEAKQSEIQAVLGIKS